ncbi:hypothetical protein H5410_061185 [Solanum commersonii]|uniref:Uncharacterized protein n=1 Tax=Solanum commersonii TaxID=4109 RepID=A0A9J5W702_SOLCO|nr:hypothetical protein H5410_061185 [Solanum commersonii]
MDVQTECSPSETPCAESEANSHASDEMTDSPIDENEVQSHISRTRDPVSNSSKSDQNLDTSNSATFRAKNSNNSDQNLDTSNSTRRITRSFPALLLAVSSILWSHLGPILSVLLPTVDSLWRVSQHKDGNADEEKTDSEEDECSLAERVASY